MRKGKIWGWSGQTPWEAFKDYCGKPNAKMFGSHSGREYHRDNVAPPTAIQGHVSSKLRVEILQGPAKGESKDVLKSSVKLKEKPVQNSKRETSEKKEADESARSTTVNNELAKIARASFFFFFNLCNEIEIRKFGITDWDVNLIEL